MVVDNAGKTEYEKIPSADVAQSSSLDKEDGAAAEGKDGDASDIKKTASEDNSGQKDRNRPMEEQNQSRKDEHQRQAQYIESTNRSMSTAVLELLCCCCAGAIQGLLH